jgi:hypothetical protein
MSDNISVRIRSKSNKMGRACGMYGRKERRVQGFGGKAQEERPLGRTRSIWEDGIKMDLREIGWVGEGGELERIHLDQDWDRWRALVNAV